MRIQVTFENGKSIVLTVPSDILLCDFIHTARFEAQTNSPVHSVVFLKESF